MSLGQSDDARIERLTMLCDMVICNASVWLMAVPAFVVINTVRTKSFMHFVLNFCFRCSSSEYDFTYLIIVDTQTYLRCNDVCHTGAMSVVVQFMCLCNDHDNRITLITLLLLLIMVYDSKLFRSIHLLTCDRCIYHYHFSIATMIVR